MKMPFGKYYGSELEKLPDGYVKWLWLKVDLREPLRNEILREYRLRFQRPVQYQKKGSGALLLEIDQNEQPVKAYQRQMGE
jgi:hypothetical protein